MFPSSNSSLLSKARTTFISAVAVTVGEGNSSVWDKRLAEAVFLPLLLFLVLT
jgi:hypothetical protein